MLGRICNGCKYLGCAVLFLKGSRRTDGNTLAAGYTGGLAKAHTEGRADFSCKAPVVGADDANPLYLAADCHAAAAENTFAVVTDHMGGRGIDLRGCGLAVIIALILYAKLSCQLLKLAVSAAYAGQAGAVMVG